MEKENRKKPLMGVDKRPRVCSRKALVFVLVMCRSGKSLWVIIPKGFLFSCGTCRTCWKQPGGLWWNRDPL